MDRTALPILLIRGVIIGGGATAILDGWSFLQKKLFARPSRNWALVGRWVGSFPRGSFVHANIAATPAIRGELALGWTFHYLVGIFYALVLLMLGGVQWARHPTPVPALLVAWATLAAPWFIMDPAMGAGVAGSKSANPTAARLRGLANHSVFGVGLYASAWICAPLIAG